VGDGDEITLGIVRAIDVPQRHDAREQAEDERDSNTGPAHQRRVAKHRISLASRGGWVKNGRVAKMDIAE
jgi:hypothetical protein